jgi:hypothetical protein
MSRFLVSAVWTTTIAGVAALLFVIGQLVSSSEPADSAATLGNGTDPVETDISLLGRPVTSSWGGWTLVDQLSAHNVLILKVETQQMHEARAIAQALVRTRERVYAEVMIYFHRPGKGDDPPARRIQWTPRGGYVETNLEEYYDK